MKCHSNSTEGASASKVYSWEIGAFFGNITSSPQRLVRQTIAKNGDMFYQPVIFPQYHFFVQASLVTVKKDTSCHMHLYIGQR